MRKLIFAVFSVLAVVVIGAWAVTTVRLDARSVAQDLKIDTIELTMKTQQPLPVVQAEAF